MWRVMTMGLAALMALPASAFAQSAAFLWVELDETPIEVDALQIFDFEGHLELEEGALFDDASATNILRRGAFSSIDEDLGGRLLDEMAQGIALYADGLGEEAESVLAKAVQQALSEPLLLADDPEVAAKTREVLLILVQLQLKLGRYDVVDETLTQLVSYWPNIEVSRKEYRPEVVDAVEASRAKLASLGAELDIRGTQNSYGCAVEINSEVLQLEKTSGRSIPIAGVDSGVEYGITFLCGDRRVGSFRIAARGSEQSLVVGEDILDALEPVLTSQRLRLGDESTSLAALAETLQTLLGVETLYLAGQLDDTLVLIRASGASLRRARADVSLDRVANRLLEALDSGRPGEDVDVDTGDGWQRVEVALILEPVLLGVGGTLLLTGVALEIAFAVVADEATRCNDEACDPSELEDELALANSLGTSGDVLLAVGGALAITGAILLALELAEDDDLGASMSFMPTQDGALATWRLTW